MISKQNTCQLNTFYLHIIRACDHPVLPGDEYCCPDWEVAHLETLDELLRLMVPDVDVPVVERDQHPLFGGVEVARLHSV